VPLVLRLSAPGFVTGCCCDIVLSADRPLRKNVTLLTAPTLRLRIVEASRERGAPDVRVELRQGGALVATGTTSGRGEVALRVPTLGQFAVRLVGPDLAMQPESLVDVWLDDDPKAFH